MNQIKIEIIEPEEPKQREDPDIYTEEGINDYCENDEIDSFEQGFMFGYLAA